MADVMQVYLINIYVYKPYIQAYCCFQVIKDYDYDKDGKLNMAEYNQYRSDSSEKSQEEDQTEVNNDDSDEVVFVELK